MRVLLHAATELELTGLTEPHFHVEGDAGGEGFGALQMFATSLALCVASVLHGYGEGVVHASIENASIRVRWQYVDHPFRIGDLAIDVLWPEVPENRVEAARRAIKSCTIHRTLEHPPTVTTNVRRA